MKVCIVAVGSELLTPFRVDTNSLAITERLNAIGGDVRLKAVVGDDVEELVRVIEGALGWADLIAITGGLGPTEDDITRDAVARVMKIPLEIDHRIVESLRERFAMRGLKMSENNARQAMVPHGATVLENPNGSAPGLWLQHGRTAMVLMPGPPREMMPMLEAVIRDRLAPAHPGAGLFRRVLKITGRPESEVDALVQSIYTPWTTAAIPIATTILAVLGQIELHLTADAPSRAEADVASMPRFARFRTPSASRSTAWTAESLKRSSATLLREARWTVAAAESCTGGLLMSRLTDVPGSSDYVDRGVVCYSNRSKTELAGVPEQVIAEHGAVSEPVARAMAEGIRARARTDVGIGVTGIAGPGGGTPEKPVGTVAIAVAAGDTLSIRTFKFFGNREMVKFQSAQAALNMLRLILLRG